MCECYSGSKVVLVLDECNKLKETVSNRRYINVLVNSGDKAGQQSEFAVI